MCASIPDTSLPNLVRLIKLCMHGVHRTALHAAAIVPLKHVMPQVYHVYVVVGPVPVDSAICVDMTCPIKIGRAYPTAAGKHSLIPHIQ